MAVYTNKKQQGVIDYFKKQTGINLNDYRDGTFEKKRGNYVTVDWGKISKINRQTIEQAANAYRGKIGMQSMGAWGKILYMNK